ncbi:MAG TPA: ComF family protein [Candidatus Binataceae bacterium]|nr:ComF family protein [Candidatus Binataceae bacterium]
MAVTGASASPSRPRAWAAWGLNFLFPLRCAGCNRLAPSGSQARICLTCAQTVRPPGEPLCLTCGLPLAGASQGQRCARCVRNPPYFNQARALACYDASAEPEGNILASILRRHKYGPNQALGAVLHELLQRDWPLAPRYDLVVPVPLHPTRLRWRGFNQAALFAAAVARHRDYTLGASVLARVIATPPQTAQDFASRQRNIHNAFALRYPGAVAGKRILMVDDVLTTGATVNECARVLRRGGAAEVDVLTVARAL